ncbi:hypothetical protein C0995_009112 [Termitomyces sp. Mi166|nr:hypothetical protein C0995_009112 [Termitomyces sp. Mi166\
MDTTALASLSLFVATPDQILESRRRTALHWGRGLSLEEYLAREEFVDKQEVARDGRLITWVLAPRRDSTSLDFLCSCKTIKVSLFGPVAHRFRRDGLVCFPSDVKPRTVVCYGISAVFTPSRFRGKGYASHMMHLLHWVIADPSLLPAVFPSEWGAPPPRVTHTGDGLFSVLWSDVGAGFYMRCGPTKDLDGWVVRSPFSTTWDVKQESSNTDTTGWTLLDESGVVKLWEDDAEYITRTLSPADDYKVSFSFLPHKGVATLSQFWRRIDFLDKRGHTPIPHWGIVGGSNTFATWTFEMMSPKTLLVTRLNSSPADFENLLGMVMSVARKHAMEKVEVYNLPDHLQFPATRLGGITVERDEHLPSFKWYGKEHSSEVAWLLNER